MQPVAEKNQIVIIIDDKKDYLDYVKDVVTLLKNKTEVVLYAEGQFISKAIDVCEVSRSRLTKEYVEANYRAHNISTNQIAGMGIFVSDMKLGKENNKNNIKLVLTQKQN